MRFDLGFCRTFAIEDLFFFFWSSRPILNELGRKLTRGCCSCFLRKKVPKSQNQLKNSYLISHVN